jgi:hypothetical protein
MLRTLGINYSKNEAVLSSIVFPVAIAPSS